MDLAFLFLQAAKCIFFYSGRKHLCLTLIAVWTLAERIRCFCVCERESEREIGVEVKKRESKMAWHPSLLCFSLPCRFLLQCSYVIWLIIAECSSAEWMGRKERRGGKEWGWGGVVRGSRNVKWDEGMGQMRGGSVTEEPWHVMFFSHCG